MSGNAVTAFNILYPDTGETRPAYVTTGNALTAVEWAEARVPSPQKPDLAGKTDAEVHFLIEEYRTEQAAVETRREELAGVYAIFLAAQRMRLPETDQDYHWWLDHVVITGDSAGGEDTPAGESSGPSSEV